MLKRAELAIGIDPGVETGFAVWSRVSRQFVELSTLSFWSAYDRVTAYQPEEIEIFIENPDSKRSMYRRTEFVEHSRQRERMATNIGSNRREATLLIERLQALDYTVHAIRPLTARKWDAAQFARYTKHSGRTSQHVRDAARIVFQI